MKGREFHHLWRSTYLWRSGRDGGGERRSGPPAPESTCAAASPPSGRGYLKNPPPSPPLLGRRQWPAGSRKSVLRQEERLWVGVGVHCFIRIEAAACFPHSDDAQDFRSDAGERQEGLTRLQMEDINEKSLHTFDTRCSSPF